MIEIVGTIDKRLITNYFPVIVYENVSHNCIHPPLEVGIGHILVHIIKSFKRRLLQQIIRLFSVCREFICESLKLRLHLKQLSPKLCSVQFQLIKNTYLLHNSRKRILFIQKQLFLSFFAKRVEKRTTSCHRKTIARIRLKPNRKEKLQQAKSSSRQSL